MTRTASVGLRGVFTDESRLAQVVVQSQYGLSVRGGQEGRHPILRMNNLQEGTVVAEDVQYVDLAAAEFAKFRLNSGDLLFNRTNSAELVGKTALFELPGDCVFASYLIRPNFQAVRS